MPHRGEVLLGQPVLLRRGVSLIQIIAFDNGVLDLVGRESPVQLERHTALPHTRAPANEKNLALFRHLLEHTGSSPNT